MVAAVVLLAIGLVIRDARLPSAGNCPSAAFVGAAVDTTVGAPSAGSASDLLACSYPADGTPAALSIDASEDPTGPRGGSPCRSRPAIATLGRGACDVSGTSGTGPVGHSVLVQPASKPGLEIQFTSHTARISLAQLETLAERTLAAHPLPISL